MTTGCQTFDEQTFADPAKSGEKTLLDWQYDALVENIGQFGFTNDNKARLDTLATAMRKLAREYPTSYRKAQAQIIQIHRSLWRTKAWQSLAGAVDRQQKRHQEPAERIRPRSLDQRTW